MTVSLIHITFMCTLILCSFLEAIDHLCPAGTFVLTTRSGLSFCHPCTDGDNFMSEWWHSHTTCNNCTQIRQPGLEILVSKCNRTHDAEILCRDGYYRRRARSFRENAWCEKCFDCENPTLPCQDYHDTVCCGSSDYEAILDNGKYRCNKRIIVCGPGQFLDITTLQCLSCPSNTYMAEVRHNYTVCNKCQTDLDLQPNQIILYPCNSKHPAIIGCKDGYFRDPLQDSLGDIKCLLCSKCTFEGRKCGLYHNSVCCPQDDMIVVDTDLEPKCVLPVQDQPKAASSKSENKDTQNVTVCGEDHYLHTDPGNNSLTCQPCGLGTYMDEQNHAKTACKNCTEIVGKYFLPKACMSSQINYYNTNSDELSNNIIIVKTVISIQNIVTVFCLSVLTLIFNNWRLKKLKKGYMKWFTVIRLIVFPLTSVTLNIILLFKEYSLWVNVAAVIVGVTCAVYLMLHIKFGSKGYITDSERNMSHRNPEFNLHNRDSNLPRELHRDSDKTCVREQGLEYSHSLFTRLVRWCTKDYYNKSSDDRQSKNEAVQEGLLNQENRYDKTHLSQEYTVCSKNPGHQNVVPIDQFTSKDLPHGYRSNELVNFIVALSDLTVHVSVTFFSERRPMTWPGSYKIHPICSDNGKDKVRAATGWVEWVDTNPYVHNNKTCPCKKCLPSAEKSQFAYIYIKTAAHVVIDTHEGKHTTCSLFFDRGGTPDLCTSVVTLQGMSDVWSEHERDWCVMRYVTHDLSLAKELKDMVERCKSLHKTVMQKYYPSENFNEPDPQRTLIAVVSHPHGGSKQVSVGYCEKGSLEGPDWMKHTNTSVTCPGSSGARVFVMGKSWKCQADHIHSDICEMDDRLSYSEHGLYYVSSTMK